MTASGRPEGLPDPSQLPALEIDPDAKAQVRRTPTGGSVVDSEAVEEYGRTYHPYKSDAYLLPNDGDEQDRLDLHHRITCLLLDEDLHKAPIARSSMRNVLDIGTGTGIWALQFAQEYPDASIVGTDLSLIQPKGIVPNVEFIREDAEGDEWTFDHSFDYIHARYFCAFVTDIRKVIQKAYKHLEPGGWLEFQETTHEMMSQDDSLNGTAIKTVGGTWNAIMVSNGRNPWAMMNLKPILLELGFVDVVEDIQPLPIGPWAKDPRYKDIGSMHGAAIERAIGSGVKALVNSGMTEGQVNHLVKQARAELRSGKVFAHQFFYVVYGRKPSA